MTPPEIEPGIRDLTRLSAQQNGLQLQAQPLIIRAEGGIIVRDAELVSGGHGKQLEVHHPSGGVIVVVQLPYAAAKNVGTKLCAPRGIEIADGGAA